MNWKFWDRKSDPASRAIILGLHISGPVHHKDYAQLAKATYERNTTVHACVSEISRACATVPWVLYEAGARSTSKTRRMISHTSRRLAGVRAIETRKYPTLRKSLEQTEVEDHPLLKLLEQPNELMAQAEFTEQLLSYWLLAGNAYQNFIAPNRAGAPPLEIWNLRPDRVTILKSENPAAGIVAGYRYAVNDKSDDFATDSVLHHKFFHPTDDFYGLSPLQAATRSWQTANIAADWNYALLTQGARPSGALVAPTTVNDDVYERLKKELTESYAGAMNAGAPMFLEGGVKWTPIGLSPLELDFLAGLKNAGVEICRVYHMPSEIIGIPDGSRTYSNFAEARMSFWQEANLPLLDRLRDAYNHRLTPLYGDRLFLDYDRDQIDAIQEDQAKVWDKLNRTRFLSTNDKRIAAGYSTYDDPMADIPESILNPTPGATGIPGAPANSPSSLKAWMTKAIEESDLSADDRAAGLAMLEQKAQKLTPAQKAALVKLRALMASHFRKQGPDFAAHMKRGIDALAS